MHGSSKRNISTVHFYRTKIGRSRTMRRDASYQLGRLFHTCHAFFLSLQDGYKFEKKKQNRLAQDGRSDVKNKKHTFPRYSQANDEREERHCCRCVIINSDASIATSTGHKILLALSQR